MKDDDWDAVLDTNLKAVFRTSRAAIRPMMKQRFGRIISITSVVGASPAAERELWATDSRCFRPSWCQKASCDVSARSAPVIRASSIPPPPADSSSDLMLRLAGVSSTHEWESPAGRVGSPTLPGCCRFAIDDAGDFSIDGRRSRQGRRRACGRGEQQQAGPYRQDPHRNAPQGQRG
eukprot:gene32075-42802_t